MDGPILSGGVIVLVAVALWLVYLVPSWQSRSRYAATERNAVRLGQALRVLAETSETPDEVQVALDTRAAYEQQKRARRTETERARLTREAEQERARVDALRVRVAAQQEQAEIAAERARILAAQFTPEQRQARARRRVRASATVITFLGVAGIGAGVWLWMSLGMQWPAFAATAIALAGVMTLQRMSRVARRASVRIAVPAAVADVARERPNASLLHDEPAPKWTPRALPQPLSSVAGSSASAAQDGIDARAALRRAALEEAARQKAAEAAPPRIDTMRPAAVPRPAAVNRFAAMGVVDDAEIEAHVRQLLASRAAS